MSQTTLTVNRHHDDEWSLSGWLLCRMAGLEVTETRVDPAPSELPACHVPSNSMAPVLDHQGVEVWGPVAIGEYLNELGGGAELLPAETAARARCRSISAEVQRGFPSVRSALPMSLKSQHRHFKVWESAKSDIDRIASLWQECLSTYGGPYLFGSEPTMADAMCAPMCTRVITYDLALPPESIQYVDTVMALPEMVEWVDAANAEPDDVEELDIEF